MSSDQHRYQVFVSSTYLDLREARQAVTLALLECDAFPTGMEIFPATDDDAWTLIKRVIDESDYYLLVIAGKYGSVDDTTGLSYTEMEYDYAVSAGKPVMAFLHSEPGKLATELTERKEDAQEKLAAFCVKVKKAKHVKFWNSPDSLAGQVALTYNKFVRQYPATGWIRADQGTATESLKELVAANAKIEELEQALKVVRTTAPAGTEHIAQGDDRVSIPYYASAKYKNPDEYAYSPKQTAGGWTAETTTWDEMFAAIAPGMLQETEEKTLRKSLEQFLMTEFFDNLVEIALKGAANAGHTITSDDLSSPEAFIREEVFGNLLVQFRALGLIQPSARKHGVNDKGTYWMLTPYGENRAIQLIALKKKDPEDATVADLNTEDESAAEKQRKAPTRRRRTSIKKVTNIG